MENRCISCGEIIPEGRQVCTICATAKVAKSFYQVRKTAEEIFEELKGVVEQLIAKGSKAENGNKQIEEMAKIIALKAFEQAHLIDGDENLADIVATDLYEKGYRKASEIFEEIEQETKNHGITYTQRKIAELKKKYTEGKKDNVD